MAVSESELHAYVDGELDNSERVTTAAEILASEELAEQVCALRSLKTLIRLAYDTASHRRDVYHRGDT